MPRKPRKSAMTTIFLLLALACAGRASDGGFPTGGSVILQTSFETLPGGPFAELQTNAGTWCAPDDSHAEINSEYAASGSQCLHLLGGGARSLIWTPLSVPEDAFLLTLRAERWTAREPFSFRIEALEDGEWRGLYVGDDEVRVGRRFLSRVEISLAGRRIEKYRFTSTSPENSGVLIDDIHLHRETPMAIESLKTAAKVTPVLVRNACNPLQSLTLQTSGFTSPPVVKELAVHLSGTDNPGDIESVQVFYSGNTDPLDFSWSMLEEEMMQQLTPFGAPCAPDDEVLFEGAQELVRGDNHFVVSCVLKDRASLVNHVAARFVDATLDSGRKVMVPQDSGPVVRHRIGRALRKSGDDGSRGYRIPGLATTNEGTLIGVYDIRYNNYGDLPEHICIGMSRSTDKGDSWEPMQTIMDMGDHEQHHGNGVGDPAVLVDRETNTVWVAAVWTHGNRGWNGSGPGMAPEETAQLLLVKSSDDGRTWSEPINITPQVKQPEWRLLLQGPGKGITLRDGTLVFPVQFKDADGLPHSTIICSKDRGETWSIGTAAMPDTTEAQVVELGDGTLMLNMRTNRYDTRGVAVTDDLGATWRQHPTSLNALTEPGRCMASLIRCPGAGSIDHPILFFSNPAASDGRHHMSIKVSPDEGMTWPEERYLLLDEETSAGYSCLTLIDDESIGILYEGSRAPLTFQKISIPWWGDQPR